MERGQGLRVIASRLRLFTAPAPRLTLNPNHSCSAPCRGEAAKPL